MVVIDRFHCIGGFLSHGDNALWKGQTCSPWFTPLNIKMIAHDEFGDNQIKYDMLVYDSIKWKCLHHDVIPISGCAWCYQFDNFLCNEWWKFSQNDDILVSVFCKINEDVQSNVKTKIHQKKSFAWLTLSVQGRVIPVQHSQYHGCWCPGSFRRQGISTHDFGYVELVTSCLTRGRISPACVMSVWRNDVNCSYIFRFPMKHIAHKGLIFRKYLIYG